jgi:oxalate decarboxylase/phosphoglucose isomerase-like protein (cupin superfamily)
MILDIPNKTKKLPNTNELYMYISNNINSIMQDPQINEMLNPQNNTTTRELLKYHHQKEAYILSYMTTIMLLLQIHDINIDE